MKLCDGHTAVVGIGQPFCRYCGQPLTLEDDIAARRVKPGEVREFLRTATWVEDHTRSAREALQRTREHHPKAFERLGL